MLVALQLVGVATVPLKVIVLAPCVAPKFVPVTVTEVPTAPELGLRLVMLGVAVVTVKLEPLLACPPTVTTTFPVVAPAGTGATMLVALQLVGVATVPLKVIVLAPCVAPKFIPVTVTEVPTAPELGLRLVMLGVVVVTVKLEPLLACPPTVTTTFPVVALAGTGATMLVALQLVGVATVPLKVIVLAPCVAPKFVPATATEVPTAPELGLRLVTLGDVPAPLPAPRKATICMIHAPPVIGAVALRLPAVVTIESSRMSLSGVVITRLVYPDPGPVVVCCTKFAPTSRSFAFPVVTEPLLLGVPFPCAAATTSTGVVVSIPLYSATRISGKAAPVLNVTVTVLLFAAAAAMFFA